MKVFLMHQDRDFDPEGALPWNEAALIEETWSWTRSGRDGAGDAFLRDGREKGGPLGLSDPPVCSTARPCCATA